MKRFFTQRLARKKAKKRTPILKSPDMVSSLLFISNDNPVHFREEIQRNFRHAKISFLHPRKDKLSEAPQGFYDYHEADFNLTGKIKNDKLTELLNTSFDLVIDLSDRNPLGDYLYSQLQYDFSVGCSNTEHDEKHDLIIRGNTDELACIKAANTQLTLLSQNGK